MESPDDLAAGTTRIGAAMALHKAGRLEEAAEIYRAILDADPRDADALHLLGLIAYQTGRLDEAAARIGAAIAERPNEAKFHSNLGNVRKAQGDDAAAIAGYRKALDLDPGFRDARFNLGVTLFEGGNLAGAAEAYGEILGAAPADLAALNNLGLVRLQQGRPVEAAALFEKVLVDPTADPATLLNLGSAQEQQGRLADAEANYRACAERDPRRPDAHFNLGMVLEKRGRLADAIAAVKAAVELDAGHTEAKATLRDLYMQACAWPELSALEPDIDDLASRSGGDSRTADTPFSMIAHCDEAARNLVAARAWAADLERRFPPCFDHAGRSRPAAGEPICIGYLSSDMRDHAVAHLMTGLFEAHDRGRFRIHVYSYGTDDDSAYRRRIAATCDSFVDIREATIEAAAQRIFADRVDILVDLNGWTRSNRLGICALRPAPVQATYLGFPGTTGATFVDYAIVDETVLPPDEADTFVESPAYLPHSFMVNDDTQEIAAETMDRGTFGLPESAVVLCSFNSPYKIDPVIFSVWMDILRAVSDAVLWLPKGNDLSRPNLRTAAAGHGIDPGRLVFAEPLAAKARHLRRMQLADLALDTRTYNGHATTCDTLWAGVPVVTIKGRHFASRVSASLLGAIGLPELIATDVDAYRDLAIRLAGNRAALAALRERLWQARTTAPLFGTARFTRAIEAVYEAMWARYLDGRPPGMIRVADGAGETGRT